MDEGRRLADVQQRLDAINFEDSIREYFERYTRPKLEENERWRRESYRGIKWPK